MSLIAQCMPEYSLRFVQRIAVAADPERAFVCARALDLSDVPLVHRYLRLRSLPKRMRAWWRGKRRPGPETARLRDLASRIPGFNQLGETPREEVVFGAIGKFWQPARPLESIAPSAFRSFAAPGFGKLALALRIAPRDLRGTWVTIELRATATDPATESQLKRAWRVIGRVAEAVCNASLQRLAADLGPLVEDESLRLPGDALMPDAVFQTTHALTWRCRRARLVVVADLEPEQSAGVAPDLLPKVGDRMQGLLGQDGDFVVARAEHARLLGAGQCIAPSGRAPQPTAGCVRMVHDLGFRVGADRRRRDALFVRVRSRWEDKLGIGLLEPLMTKVHDALSADISTTLAAKPKAGRHNAG